MRRRAVVDADAGDVQYRSQQDRAICFDTLPPRGWPLASRLMRECGLVVPYTRAMSQVPYGALRTGLIAYGTAAFTMLWTRSGLTENEAGAGVAASRYVLAGLGVQMLLIAARALIKRRAPDAASARRALAILELVADGVTVLLFAVGTLSAITQRAGNL